MKGTFWWLVVGVVLVSGCSETDSEELKPDRRIVLSIDGTAESITGENSTASGGEFFHAISSLVALNGPVELRVRDHVGEMIFLIPGEANLGDLFMLGELMSIEIRSESVAMSDLELNEEEFLTHLKPYVESAKIVGSRPLIIVSAADSSRMVDCLKYLRILYDAGVNLIIDPPQR